MRVLVTGAGGQVGRAVTRTFGARGDEVTALDHAALDVTDEGAVRDAVADARPDLVVHAAAWTDVDGAESDPAGAEHLNVAGTAHVADATRRAGARLVAYSTDFVFDGEHDEAYLESDAPRPISVYGRTKLAGEEAARRGCPDACWIVRTAWVHAEEGSNFVRTILRLAGERDELRVVADQRGCPTYATHLAEGTAAVLERCPPATYHLAGSGATTREGWARAIVEDAGLACRIVPATSDEFPTPARRPASSVLGSLHTCAAPLPPWRVGLRTCLAGMGLRP